LRRHSTRRIPQIFCDSTGSRAAGPAKAPRNTDQPRQMGRPSSRLQSHPFSAACERVKGPPNRGFEVSCFQR
jgi:hypothetical protein